MTTLTARWLDALPRPLDFIPWIKVKFAVLLVCAGTAGLAYFTWRIGWFPVWTSIWALIVVLVTSQVLAHGMTRPLREMTAAARRMAAGDYSRRVRATSRDEVGQLASAFNRMAAELDAADRQRRELIANVSHELRTPISALQAVMENLVDGVTPADPATLHTALTQCERLGSLVTELLDLSRLDAGVLTLDRTRFALEPLLAEVVAETEVNAAAAGRSASVHVDIEPLDAEAFADRGRLHQVLVNLLDNAVRHGPPDGQVRLSARTTTAGMVLEVADQGPGIPPDERRLVFQRFTRGERADHGGTGLGLAIARWIVDLHGGTIEAAAARDRPGCLIRVTLPTR